MQQINVTISVCLIHRQNIVVAMVIVMWIQKEYQDVCKLILSSFFSQWIQKGVRLLCLALLSAIFQLYRGDHLYW
jgi:hypothetical protein